MLRLKKIRTPSHWTCFLCDHCFSSYIGVQYHLVQAANKLRVVVAQDRRDPAKLRMLPPIEPQSVAKDGGVALRVEIRLLGYIGSYCANSRNAKHMLALRGAELPEVLESIVNPALEVVGEWNDVKLPEYSQCNESQVR